MRELAYFETNLKITSTNMSLLQCPYSVKLIMRSNMIKCLCAKQMHK